MDNRAIINKTDFPILGRQVYGKPLIYLDNAATTQKPRCVVEAISDEYYNVNANVHRGVHYLSQQATELHESAREKMRGYINARKKEEIVFTRGTTESINLLASTFCEAFCKEGDIIVTTDMEHHSNIVPWQMQARKYGLVITHIPFNDNGELCLDCIPYDNPRVKLITLCHVSNVLGTVNPVKEICRKAHERNIPVLIDGAQSAPHLPIDVQDIGCDFFALSGHKMYGPTGVGVLYGKEEWLEKLPPYQGGGEMIDRVTWEGTTYGLLPYKFEAGTPDYIGTHALGVAAEYLQSIGMEKIHAYEQELLRYATERMQEIEGLRIYGTAEGKDAVISFLLGDIHHLDTGMLLDRLGIAVRTGHHCAQPCMDALKINGTVRVSFALYNTKEEIDTFVEALQRIKKMF
ncbi:MAG: cysteine desulfurase [Bacteroidaceae bacterium]|nr:cysteine desulfurase [Bacteroidaceae bacterium]